MAKKLKIALIGYGKMGQMIDQISTARGHDVIARLNASSDLNDWNKLSEADVAIEFTNPHSALANIKTCFELNLPVVVGTTGWYQHLNEMILYSNLHQKALLTASNFSIGVNLFFHINKLLAKAMENLPDYDVCIEEIHHTRKMDSPSGTAITIAEGILNEISRKHQWVLSDKTALESDLVIDAIRKDDVPGTHTVQYKSIIDDIEIKHTAHNRSGFATGAVIAAEWLHDKKGYHNMSEIIGF